MAPRKRSIASGADVDQTRETVVVPTTVLAPGKRTRVASTSRKKESAVQELQGDYIQKDEVREASEDREPSPGYPSSSSSQSDFVEEDEHRSAKSPKKAAKKKKKVDSEPDETIEYPPREPPVDSLELPFPWKGRLGYACLNTILRARRDPTFCSRTCRLDSINKMGIQFAKDLGRQNAGDLSAMIQWNEDFGIRFLRVSSEMFPFASHAEHGYDLSHADAELRAAGALAMKYGHRLTAHPGQFTQIASPRPEVFTAAVRDLEMHEELLTRLGLQGQTDRDAIMVIHLGGSYGDKDATIERFKTNYAKLSDRVKRRLVLENDDVTWSVEDLLPLCEELNIPLVLDWHHNNIVPGSMREGTLDVHQKYLSRITQTWRRKEITPKQHYSEAREPNNPSPHKRRAHSRRVHNFPPCAPDMDLMIEAKDKEQAVFELSRIHKLDRPPLPREVVVEGDRDGEGYYPEGEEARLKPPSLGIVKQREKELRRLAEGAEDQDPDKSQEKTKTRRRKRSTSLVGPPTIVTDAVLDGDANSNPIPSDAMSKESGSKRQPKRKKAATEKLATDESGLPESDCDANQSKEELPKMGTRNKRKKVADQSTEERSIDKNSDGIQTLDCDGRYVPEDKNVKAGSSRPMKLMKNVVRKVIAIRSSRRQKDGRKM